MISTLFLTKIFSLVAFLGLLSLMSCEGEVREIDGDPVTDFVSGAVGVYSGTLTIGADSFPDIRVQVSQESFKRLRVGSASDLIRPFACNLDEDAGFLLQEDDGKGYFMSVNLNVTPAEITIFYSSSDQWFLGRKLY